ncbi:hypothetical protein B5S31_g795 [[Candida] boidinii]|nr:hypothetical protein B5S31_g795 [[Candida] boidinii]GME68866.1 unnamed protein product [[Candida] boidinii]
MSSKKDKIYSPSEIEDLIARGSIIIIYKRNVLKLNGFIERHPGGEKIIHHFIGRDATDEMNSYHVDETVNAFNKFKIGEIDHSWINFLPPIQGGIYKKIGENLPNDKKPAGTMPVEIIPKIPQGVILSIEKTELYPIKHDPYSYIESYKGVDTYDDYQSYKDLKSNISSIIRDPEEIIENYDNNLVKQDLETLPSLDYETQRKISEKYNALHKLLIEKNLYDCPYIEYFYQFCRCLSLFLYFLIFLKIKWLTLSAISIGFCWQQLTFIAHDAGHIAITHNYQFDNIIGVLIADLFGGLSIGWWKRNHNIHHLVTNDPVHDPDIQHLPFFAVSTRLFGNVFSTYYEHFFFLDSLAKFLVQFQGYTYYPFLAFGRFNLYRLSWTYLILDQGPKKGKIAWLRYFEIACLGTFFYWFFYLVVYKCIDNWKERIIFVLVSHVASMLVHVQITLSHFAMSTSDLGTSEGFASRQLRTTMDVDCPEWLDYLHGGLQFQAIHHLFPRIPRHNFRKAQKYVIEFCEDVGLPYSIYGFGKGNAKVINKMDDVGKQLKIFKDCLKGMKSEAVDCKNLYEKRVESVLNDNKKHE